jgi:2-methylisocitrate lyase-like PEP mutase family enzyme
MGEKDRTFHRLHETGLLLLANAWDAGSGRLVQSRGGKAVATSSAAVAWSHGYPDGDHLPVPLLVATIEAMARVLEVPLSADVEGGYHHDPDRVGETVGRVVVAGAVGINIEDGTGDPDLLCAKIERARRAADREGVDLFVNARTDVYLRGLVPAERAVGETLARAERYRGAGADGLFVPGVTAAADIKAIVASAGLPLNVLARPGLPPATELAALGVRRLSAGSWLAQAALGGLAAQAAAFLKSGLSEPLAAGALTYAEINALMPAPPDR